MLSPPSPSLATLLSLLLLLSSHGITISDITMVSLLLPAAGAPPLS
jgi:hypothetical protein